jgi:hypothetical protein
MDTSIMWSDDQEWVEDGIGVESPDLDDGDGAEPDVALDGEDEEDLDFDEPVEPEPVDEGESIGADGDSLFYCTYVGDWAEGGDGEGDGEVLLHELASESVVLASATQVQTALVGIALCLANPHDQLLC